MEHWTCFVGQCEQDLLVGVREHLPLHTPTAEDCDLVLLLGNTFSTAPISDPVVAAAVAALAQAEIDHRQLCFCYCDLPDMEKVRLKCCKRTIHWQCVIAYLGINSQCAYYCGGVFDIAGVLALPTIDRCEIISTTMSTPQRTPPVTRDLQSMLLDKTSLRLSDQLCTQLQEKKHESQHEQAAKMIKTQGKDIANKWVAPGAVVTVQCDYRAVSHSIRIVGIIYKVSKFGGAWIATIARILSSGSRKGPWWIPLDQYAMRYGANEDTNITPQLMQIHVAILVRTYNVNNSAPKCTIQEAHQQITQAISPCRKSKCKCKGGACKAGCCGCIKKGFKCTSTCPCNGNCTANPNNGKLVVSVMYKVDFSNEYTLI